MNYKSPKNKEQYWKIINDNWNDISYVMNVFLPTYQRKWIDKSNLNETMMNYLERLREKKDSKLVRAISAAQYLITEEFECENYDVCNMIKVLCYDQNYLIDEGE